MYNHEIDSNSLRSRNLCLQIAKSWEIEGLWTPPPYDRVRKVLMSPDTHRIRNIAIGTVTIPPGSKSDTHAHVEAEEFWIFTAGHGEVFVGKEKAIVEPGMVVYAPPKTNHHIVNTGKDTLIAYFIFSPPGPEKFLLSERLKADGKKYK